MSNTKISIIVPVYNTEAYLRECINSIISQTLRDIEIILIDNNSNDNSKLIIEEFSKNDIRIIFIQLNKNYGSGEARNIGLRVAKGEFIAFMDSDDFYYSNYVLETLYKTAMEKKVDICGGNIMYLDMKTIKEIPLKREFFNEEKFITLKDYIEFGGYFRFIYRTNIIKENYIFFPDYFRRQDPVWFYKIMTRVSKIYVLPYYVYVYRVFHKTVEWNERQILDALCSYKDNFKILKKYKLYEHYRLELNDFKNKQLINREKYLNKNIQKLMLKIIKSISFDLIIPSNYDIPLNNDEKIIFEAITKKIKENKNSKPYIIIGFGNLGQVIYKYLAEQNLKVEFIFDKSFKGLKVDKNLKIISTLEIASIEINFDEYNILNTILNKSFIDELQSSFPNKSLV